MWLLSLAAAVSVWLLWSRQQPESALLLRDFVAQGLPIQQNVHIRFADRGFTFPDLVEATQRQLDFRLKTDNVSFQYTLIDELPATVARPPDSHRVVLFNDVALTDGVMTQMPVYVEEFATAANDTGAVVPEHNASLLYAVDLHFSDKPKMWLDTKLLTAHMAYSLDYLHQNDLPFFLTQTIYDNLLEADLQMLHQIKSYNFSDYSPRVKVNFVAAEELGLLPAEVGTAIADFLATYNALVSPLVTIDASFQTLDVSKRRAAPHLTRNTLNEITFFYSTTMRPYADSIQGVPLHHIDLVVPDKPTAGDLYGTEYQEQLRKAELETWNVTSFVRGISASMHTVLKLPAVGTATLQMKADGAAKHFTLKGIEEILDMLVDHFDAAAYKKISKFIDALLLEHEHDWLQHLHTVYVMHGQLTARKT